MDHYTYIDDVLLSQFYTQVLYKKRALVNKIENKLTRASAEGKFSLIPSFTIKTRSINVLPFDEKIYLLKILEDFFPKLLKDQTINPFSSLQGRLLFGNVKVSHIQFKEGLLLMIPYMPDLHKGYNIEKIGEEDNAFIILGDQKYTWNNRYKSCDDIRTSAYSRFREILGDHKIFRKRLELQQPELSLDVRQKYNLRNYLIDMVHWYRESFDQGEFRGLFFKREFIKGSIQNLTVLYPIYLVDDRKL